MEKQIVKRTARAGLLALALAFIVQAAGTAPALAEGKPKSGTVTIEQVNVAMMWSASLGGGTLKFKGKSYDFIIGGLGIGGIGASSLNATGTVYGLERAEDFEGTYGQLRKGYVAGDKGSSTLWLENTNGVQLELSATRAGLALALGADGVVIQFK